MYIYIIGRLLLPLYLVITAIVLFNTVAIIISDEEKKFRSRYVFLWPLLLVTKKGRLELYKYFL